MDATMVDLKKLRGMSSQQLIQRLAEREDVDDVMEAELQRRSLSKLNLMTWTSLAMVSAAVIGLTLSGLYLGGILSRRGRRVIPVEVVATC